MLKKFKALNPEKRSATALVILLVIVLAILLIAKLMQPERSVSAYCKVYKQQAAKLGNAGGNANLYSTSVFPNASSNDAGYFIPTFDKLDAVAPKEIEPQVKAMRDIFAKMQSDPDQTVSLALNGLPAEQTVTQWTQQHCEVPSQN